MKNSIKSFIRANSTIVNGDLIFPTTQGSVYKDFTTRINYTFRGLKPKKISANILRHSCATHYMNNKTITLNTIKLLATYLGHSPTTLLAYRRFGSQKDKDDLYKKVQQIKN